MATNKNQPPGPKGSFLQGVLPHFLQNPLQFLTQSAADHGDIVLLRFLNRRVYLLNHPDYIQHVLVNNQQNYLKGRALAGTRPVIGQGLLTSEGEFHRRQRRLIQPAFHRRQIATFAGTMTAFTERHTAVWQEGQALDLHQELMRLTMATVTRTLFGLDIAENNGEVAKTLNRLMEEFSLLDSSPLGQWLNRLPTPRRRRREALLRVLDEAIYGFIGEGQRHRDEEENLMSLLLAARDVEGDGAGMSQQQLRDEVMTLFIAGHETTANALTWSFYLLSQHPEVAARLQTELAQVLAGRLPAIEDVPALKYTRRVFSEALRLYPPAWIIGRTALANDMIGGYRIPAGSTVLVSPWVMHRHPAYWTEPSRFWPERFEPEQPASQKLPRYAYFPFGGGPRLCIGEPFAWLEGTLLIATLAQRFNFKLALTAQVACEPRVTLRPKYGLPVIIHRRRPNCAESILEVVSGEIKEG
jgi:cytochrome P450